jgi:hypothetical protein
MPGKSGEDLGRKVPQMPAIDRIAGSLVLAAIACSGAGAAAQQNLSLPDVTVTAPPVAPPPIAPSAKPNPYFGNPRVDEDKWPEIPCATSRIDLGATSTCRRGPPQHTFERGDAQGSRQQSNCNIAHDLVISNIGALAIEADVLVFDPYYVSAIGHQRQDCYVETGYSDLREDFPDMNQMTRRGNAWRNFLARGDLITMEFSAGPDNCLAFEKRGPRWGGGYIYVIHASICRKDRRAVEDTDVAIVVGSLQVQRRDPGGLR